MRLGAFGFCVCFVVSVMPMFQFFANDFLACNGTRQGATHLHQRMKVLCDALNPRLTELSSQLVPVVSPIYNTLDFRPNRNRPRDHACLYFVDRKLKKSAFPRLPQLGVYVHQNALAIGFYSGVVVTRGHAEGDSRSESFSWVGASKGLSLFGG